MRRHTFATSLVGEDTPLNEVADLLGHESMNTTRIYTHIPTERLRKSILTIPVNSPSETDRIFLNRKKLTGKNW
ncbi:MAG: tyrosine-type recombinase/integrase [Prevotellaceae bacterium]|nr:tyrosine-type recombinase/integrase [Prevotellaceae bacterium]